MNFRDKYKFWVDMVNRELDRVSSPVECPQASIYDAVRYSLMAGGKRLRPVLTLAVNELFEGDAGDVLPFGCAIEMIHTYSLIHDDLPAMDNDDYRRGRLTNHKVYGEAKAILAGDALLNLAFEVMSDAVLRSGKNTACKLKAMNIVAKASGMSGMIGGQVLDLDSEGKEIEPGLLEYMHKCKTGALIKASVLASAAINGVSGDDYDCLEAYAEKIGLAFQIKDDILDVEGNSEIMGKLSGSDEANKKSTFVTVYGFEESKRRLEEIVHQASDCVTRFGRKSDFLKELAFYIMKRDN